ncbi:hypothetical protein EG359_08550 [Chryseobacterium joostei]|uniref:GLPGLI family protein n=2 Tax=Chryseobacterium joostei TaxID=112234 RepID=A0ABN5SCP7_9FLAO|nr:hypothetical protein EG359_08550 [Chryseobacterium joostei]
MKISGKSILIMMKFKNVLLLAFFLGSFVINAQVRATVSGKTYDLESVKLTIDGFVITLDSEGLISDFNAPDLNGKIEYYDDKTFDKIKYGKLKSIGGVKIDYWDELGWNSAKNGKLKSIGSITVDYWDDSAFTREKAGKIKKIGDLNIDYWPDDVIDNSRMGKLKTIGDISIDYGTKDIIDQSKFQKLIKFGPVSLDYSNDKFINKQSYGLIKSINGNSEKISVSVL